MLAGLFDSFRRSHSISGNRAYRMNKRYQIFVSSTYADLKEEREQIIYELTKTGFIAVGMEQFRATDEEQMEYIRPLIDETDYYILIVKGRYGSLAPDGLSYTHKEYLYAREKKIPVLAFLYKDITELKYKEMDSQPELTAKLKEFRDELTSQRIVDFWETPEELIRKVKDSLNLLIRRRPGIGWIRGDQAMDPSVYKDLEAARRTIEELRSQLSVKTENDIVVFPNSVSHGSDTHRIAYASYLNEKIQGIIEIKVSWDEIILFLAQFRYQKINEESAMYDLFEFLKINKLDTNDFEDTRVASPRSEIETIRSQLEYLGLIAVIPSDFSTFLPETHWKITEKGRKYIGQLTAIRRNSAEAPPTPPAPRP